MEEDICPRICSCVKKKPLHIKPAGPLGTITTTQPMEIVSIDFFHLDQCSGSYEYLLVATYYCTRYTQAYPSRSKASRTAVERLFHDFILIFGMSKHILHDQGKEFDNRFFHQLTKLCGFKQLRSTLYHPQTNRAFEVMNSTICSMLKTLTDKEKTTWKDHINKLIFAYNWTKHSSSGYSPYYLLFG